MTRKDFKKVAAAVANITMRSDRWLTANLLADTFQAQYPRFDRDRFIAACRPAKVGTLD